MWTIVGIGGATIGTIGIIGLLRVRSRGHAIAHLGDISCSGRAKLVHLGLKFK